MKGIVVFGLIGSFLMPLAAIVFCLSVMTIQAFAGDPVGVGDLKVLAIVFAAGGAYMQTRKNAEDVKKMMDKMDKMATKSDIGLLKDWIEVKFQTKQGCEDLHQAKAHRAGQ